MIGQHTAQLYCMHSGDAQKKAALNGWGDHAGTVHPSRGHTDPSCRCTPRTWSPPSCRASPPSSAARCPAAGTCARASSRSARAVRNCAEYWLENVINFKNLFAFGPCGVGRISMKRCRSASLCERSLSKTTRAAPCDEFMPVGWLPHQPWGTVGRGRCRST